jgi:hypothetical protein
MAIWSQPDKVVESHRGRARGLVPGVRLGAGAVRSRSALGTRQRCKRAPNADVARRRVSNEMPESTGRLPLPDRAWTWLRNCVIQARGRRSLERTTA